MTAIELHVDSKEYIALGFDTNVDDPLLADVDFGFTTEPGVAPDAWYPATVAPVLGGEDGAYEATLCVGPGSPDNIEFDAGVASIVWARLTDTPEIPIEPVGVVLPYTY